MQSTKRLMVIGTESHYGREITEGIHNYCRAHGRWEYHLEGDNSPESVKLAAAAIQNWKVDGIIACVRSSRVERLLLRSHLPAVNVSAFRSPDMPTVILDSIAMGRMVAGHFLDSGFRNFAYYADFDSTNHLRCQGFVEELSKTGFGCTVFKIPPSVGDAVWVKLITLKKLDHWLLSLKKPVALMCAHDLRAQEIAMACRRVGLRVPDDVAIVGAGNQPLLCKMATPPLSSVDINIQRIGYEAAKLLHHMLRGGKAPARPILIPPRCLVSRQSSDMIAIADPDVAAAMRYIRANAHEPINGKDLLREIPLSKRTLERRFAALLGRSPRGEIVRLRLERAKSLLEDRDLPIKSVIAGSGFVNPRTFAYFFRRKMGLSPTQYRRNCSKIPGNGDRLLSTSVK